MSMGPLKFEFKRPALSVSGEIGSLSELVGALQDEGGTLVKMFGSDMELLVTGLGDTAQTGEASGTAKTETAAQKKKREKEEAKAASEAARVETAPPAAPAPIPAGTAPDTTPNAAGIPAFLQAAPPPPPPPVAPAPPVPPSGVLAGKLIPHMEGIAVTQADGGQAYADWLAQAGIVVSGATFAEAMKVIRMQPDEKLKPIADALGIAA